MYCKTCGKEVSKSAIACLSCGMDPRDGHAHCSSCGSEVKEKQVICISCGCKIESSPFKSLSLIGQRFILSFLCSLTIFVLITLSALPEGQKVVGIIGSVAFALFSGVLAMAIPTKQKIVYMPVSVVVSIVIAYIIGTMT